MNLKIIHELLTGWLETGFTVKCDNCHADDYYPGEIEVTPGACTAICNNCGYDYPVLVLLFCKLNELND